MTRPWTIVCDAATISLNSAGTTTMAPAEASKPIANTTDCHDSFRVSE